MKINLSDAASYEGPLSPERRAAIVDHLKDMGPARQQRAVAVIIGNGGEEAAFVRHLTRGAAPMDKQARVPQSK